MISTNQIVHFNAVQFFEEDKSCFVVRFLCHLGHVVYLDQKVKRSKLPKYQIVK